MYYQFLLTIFILFLLGSNSLNSEQHPANSKLTIVDLFRPLPIMLRTFNLFLQWFSVTMTFYGLTFASATLELTGNVYMNFTLNVLVEFIASITGVLLIDKLGRRPFMIGTQLVSGICVLICGSMVTIQVSFHLNCISSSIIFAGPLIIVVVIFKNEIDK